MIRLKLIGCALAALVVAASHASHAQEWPNRPVKVVVPFAAAVPFPLRTRLGRPLAVPSPSSCPFAAGDGAASDSASWDSVSGVAGRAGASSLELQCLRVSGR